MLNIFPQFKYYERLNYAVGESHEPGSTFKLMTMIAALEDAFNITFEMDDIIDFSSYKTGKEILKKYKVNIS